MHRMSMRLRKSRINFKILGAVAKRIKNSNVNHAMHIISTMFKYSVIMCFGFSTGLVV
jgi:hypothetical protein